MAAFVRETEAGWEVVDGRTVLSVHASRIAALDAALVRNGGKTKDAILRDPDSHDLNGAWRWLHATDVEDVPAYDGARIDETTVREAVASLNAAPLPRPINGGAPDSPAHAPAGDSIATGYAHHAVEVIDADGRVGAYVIAELVPDVARVVDSGRVAWTSIGLGGTVGDDATIRDAEFDHLALTNTPAVKTLTASAAIRKPGERFVAVRSHRVTATPKRTAPMADTNTAPAPAAAPAPAPAAPPAAPAVRAEMDPMLSEAIAKAMEGGASMEQLLAAIEACKPEPVMESEKQPEAATRSETEKAVLSRIAKLEADHERTALRSHVEHEFAKAKATPADLDSLVTDLIAIPASSPVRAKLLALSIRSAVGAPPVARPLPATGSVDATPETVDAPEVTDPHAAIDASLKALRTEGKLSGPELFNAAREKARKDFPKAFASR